MGSLSELPRRPTQKMGFFALLTLAAVALADNEREMMKKWIKIKAMESCWGSENMKMYTVEMKKAIAKCSNEDAPELSLPPYRSSYRFVNAMINPGNNMDMLKNMMAAMSMSMNQDNSEFSYVQPYSTNSGKSDSFMDKMKMMMMKMKMKMKDMMRSNYQDDYDMAEFFKSMGSSDRMDNYRTGSYRKNDPMSQFKQMFNSYRSKRQAGRQDTDSLDLGDRLVEKLAEQKHQMEAKIGNMTCVLKETNTLDASNNLDIQAMKRDAQQYTMPSPWFGKKYEEILDTCYEMATSLPAEMADNSVVSGSFGTVKLGEIKMFTKCYEKAETKLCMNQDMKTKVESNFGPMEALLEQTQLTEAEFFPLVMQLLHGQEMDYMAGSM